MTTVELAYNGPVGTSEIRPLYAISVIYEVFYIAFLNGLDARSTNYTMTINLAYAERTEITTHKNKSLELA